MSSPYVIAATILAMCLAGLFVTILVIIIPGRLIWDRVCVRSEVKRFTDDYVAENADVAALERQKAAEAEERLAIADALDALAEADRAIAAAEALR